MATEAQTKLMGELYSKYGLTPEDVFEHSNYKIITRQGIDKILSGADIKFKFVDKDIQYKLFFDAKKYAKDARYGKVDIKEVYNKVGTFATVKILGGVDGENPIETYGESTPYNTTNEYAVAMAEKRAKSRLALMATGLYAHGFFGEDEADDFKRSKHTTTAVVK